ncbi:hypothetical protein [Pseudoxanthomonas composti]|uniref:Uncharacterized protein n=1 Tax=Pseudoxanthomonas composti TaxID=2137479 RepID=A0A4Q1JX23_9GAMM|nr:hypothetical protein [Pseudoxanthomonas composti]RXR07186.1 hypothetical protein EPA99_04500 [Pseudoxanthomonas composti]
MATSPPPWRKAPPRTRAKVILTEAQKEEARERAEANGRRYPNLIDNMYVTRKAKADGTARVAGQQRSDEP